MQDHRLLHTEVRRYADMILHKLVPKRGSLLEDAPEYSCTVHLQEHVFNSIGGCIEDLCFRLGSLVTTRVSTRD